MVRHSKPKRNAKKERVPTEKRMGFFAMHRDVLPKEPVERTRVKTFIVEKPIIIQEKPQRIVVSREDGDEFDSKKNHYSKRKHVDDFKEDYVDYGEGRSYGDESEEDDDLGVGDEEVGVPDDYGPDVGIEEDRDFGENKGGGVKGGFNEKDFYTKKSIHSRSYGLFENVWWKKAIIWAIVIWLLVLFFELGMQAIGLVEVGLTRQWLFLLIGFLGILLIYFRIFDGKINF